MKFNYYYGTEADQFTFIRIPKVMLTDDSFALLSLQSKILYGVLLDRMSLSMKNGWLDKENKVYIIFQINEIQENLGFSKKKAIDYLTELEKFGLLEKKRRGLGLPSILYVKSFMVKKAIENTLINDEDIEMGTSRSNDLGTSGKLKAIEKSDNNGIIEKEIIDKVVKKARISKKAAREDIKEATISDNLEYIGKKLNRSVEMGTSRGVEMGTSRSVEMGTSRSVEMGTSRGVETKLQEVSKTIPLYSKTDINNTYVSNNKSNHIKSDFKMIGCEEINIYSKLIKENISYDSLIYKHPYDKELIDGIYNLILEVVLGQGKEVLIASNKFPISLVKNKLLKLDSSHIEYVINCLQKNTTKVINIKKYLLATLFNASNTISGYYQSEVNHDMPQYAKVK